MMRAPLPHLRSTEFREVLEFLVRSLTRCSHKLYTEYRQIQMRLQHYAILIRHKSFRAVFLSCSTTIRHNAASTSNALGIKGRE
jgi:hypothetical protein